MSWEEKVVVEGMGREDPEPEEPLWRNHFSSPAAAGWSGGVSAETGESWVPSVSPPPRPFPSLLPVFPLPLWYISNPTSPVSSKWYVPLVTFQDFSEVKYAPGSQIRQSPQAVLPFSTLPHASAQSCAVDWGVMGGEEEELLCSIGDALMMQRFTQKCHPGSRATKLIAIRSKLQSFCGAGVT